MKKKLILFDWGGIVESHITGFTCFDAWNELFFLCGYDGPKITNSSLVKYRMSSIENEQKFRETYKKLAKEFHLTKSFSEFIKLYKRIFAKVDYYKEVAEFEHSLKDKCSIGIFSNLTYFDKKRLDKHVSLKEYDYVFLSFEYGYRKPEKEFYEIIQSRVPFKPEDILFFDDRLDNILSARKMGWNAVQITGLELDKMKKICAEFIND